MKHLLNNAKKVMKVMCMTISFCARYSYLLIGVLEIMMLIGVYLVLNQRIIEIQIMSFMLFIKIFFVWAIVIIAIQLLHKSNWAIDTIGKQVSVFLTILIIALGLITGISVMISDRSFVSIPDLQGGTFGFRTWNCYASIEDIHVSYQDVQSSAFIGLSDEVLYDVNNWSRWGDPSNDNEKPILYETREAVIIKTKGKSNSPRIHLNNSGAFFNLNKIGVKPKVRNASIEAVVIFHSAKEDSSAYANFEISLRVPWDDKKEKPSSNLYIGLQTFFLNPEWSKCYIPALDLKPSSLHHDSFALLKKSVGFEKYTKEVKYLLKGVWYDDYVGLYVKNVDTKASGILYEGNIAPGQISKQKRDIYKP